MPSPMSTQRLDESTIFESEQTTMLFAPRERRTKYCVLREIKYSLKSVLLRLVAASALTNATALQPKLCLIWSNPSQDKCVLHTNTFSSSYHSVASSSSHCSSSLTMLPPMKSMKAGTKGKAMSKGASNG